MVRLLSAVLFGAQLFSTVTSHSILGMLPRQGEFPYPIIGSDIAADSATTGTFLNHMAINTRNLTASIEFYTELLGFRKLFTLQITKTYSITYLAHAQGGRNGTGYQTALEMNREKNNAQGLIEICYVDVPVKNIESGAQHPNTFGHIGIVVPDIQAFQERLDTMPHISVLKRSGEPFVELDPSIVVGPAVGLLPDIVEQLDEEERKAIVKNFGQSVEPLIFIADPDGNFIEVQPQEGAALVG
jgi:lactoylglutathione lyase